MVYSLFNLFHYKKKQKNKISNLKDHLRSKRRDFKYQSQRFHPTEKFCSKFFWAWERLPNNTPVSPSLIGQWRRLPSAHSLVYPSGFSNDGYSFKIDFWDEIMIPELSEKWKWCVENGMKIPKIREWVLDPSREFIVLEFENESDMIMFKMRF